MLQGSGKLLLGRVRQLVGFFAQVRELLFRSRKIALLDGVGGSLRRGDLPEGLRECVEGAALGLSLLDASGEVGARSSLRLDWLRVGDRGVRRVERQGSLLHV